MADCGASQPNAPRPHGMTVQPGAWRVPVPAGHSLLQAALAAGVRLPSSCRNGSCRACLARLLSGQIHYLVEWPGLLAEEKDEGWILPCVACADSDLVILASAAKLLPA